MPDDFIRIAKTESVGSVLKNVVSDQTSKALKNMRIKHIPKPMQL